MGYKISIIVPCCCFIVMLIALFMFVLGVVLSTLQEKDRRDFEIKLVQAGWLKTRRR